MISGSYICGTMCASDVPEAPSPVATFFEGEIIDNVNHSFYTADWDAVRIAGWRAGGWTVALHAIKYSWSPL